MAAPQTVAALLVLLAAASGPVRAQATEGLNANPPCDLDFLVTDSLRDHVGVVSTGEKASGPDWDMEIYAQPKTGSWVLLGRRKSPEADQDELCYLARGTSAYRQAPWYRTWFKPASAQASPPQRRPERAPAPGVPAAPATEAAPRIDCAPMQRLIDHATRGDGFEGVLREAGRRRSALTIPSTPFRDCAAIRSRDSGKVHANCDVFKADDRAGKPPTDLAPPAYFGALNGLIVKVADSLSVCVGSEPTASQKPSLDPIVGAHATDIVLTWTAKSSTAPARPVRIQAFFVLPDRDNDVEVMRDLFQGFVSIDGQLP